MSFVGNIFGAYAARATGRYNEALYKQQAALEKRNAEIKIKTFVIFTIKTKFDNNNKIIKIFI